MSIVEFNDAYIIEDRGGKLWLPLNELPEDKRNPTPDLIRVGDRYFDVMGYSIARKALWVQQIHTENAASDIDAELADYLAQQQL